MKTQFQILLSGMTPANSCGFQESVSSVEIQPGELSHSKAENSDPDRFPAESQ